MTDLVLASSATTAVWRRLRSQHGGALGAHLPQLFEPSLVALAPRGDAAFEPVRLDLELGVELVGGAGLLGIDLSSQAS
jgi:hypothetical protein